MFNACLYFQILIDTWITYHFTLSSLLFPLSFRNFSSLSLLDIFFRYKEPASERRRVSRSHDSAEAIYFYLFISFCWYGRWEDANARGHFRASSGFYYREFSRDFKYHRYEAFIATFDLITLYALLRYWDYYVISGCFSTESARDAGGHYFAKAAYGRFSTFQYLTYWVLLYTPCWILKISRPIYISR